MVPNSFGSQNLFTMEVNKTNINNSIERRKKGERKVKILTSNIKANWNRW